MTCDEFGKMLDNYENLTEDEKLSLNEHASQCVHCREELDFMLAMIAQLNALPKIGVPSDFGAKLKKRIGLSEAETSGFNRVLVLVRENYRRYSTVAACLVLAVVLGANGKSLMNRLTPSTDNKTVLETTVSSSPQPETDKTPVAEVSEQTPVTAVSGETNASSASDLPAKSVNTASRQERVAIEHIQTMSESINQVDINPSTAAPVYAESDNLSVSRGRMLDENAGIALQNEIGTEGKSSYSENYKIARGVYRLPNPEIAEEEAGTRSKDEVLPISEINTQSDMAIARGRYYIPADEGHIAIDSDNAIGVNGADAARAEELIRQYADIQDESYYVINAENIPSMLERMNGEGINYQNNMVNADNDKVSFKLVIE